MQLLFKPLAVVSLVSLLSFSPAVQKSKPVAGNKPTPKIQVAILLDVSGSMEGLIQQAKEQLWNMVTTLGKAKCTDQAQPQVELALYEYGRTTNDVAKGYVKQLSPFTNDLDEVSKILFGLKTDGGAEYCGQVIFTSIDELKWETGTDHYKVIFIAGNEDFLQGNLHYTKACNNAREKGVIVNTLYCGSYERGIAEHWNLLGECGNGSFTNIDHNAKEPDIYTPYDTTLMVLNQQLNNTYIGYGAMGIANATRQQEQDRLNYALSKQAGMKRAEAKAKSNVYNNASWDLVDAVKADTSYFRRVDRNTLPDSLKNKTAEQLRQLVLDKTAEREKIQKEIQELSANRSKYIAEVKARLIKENPNATLETAVEKTIKEQVQRANMKID
ncbi:MAG: VWA domain-containing protein [Chitinophagaceae bacterium]|nr:VWA domain-containing protein [Chitinophagaceae bacterium]